MPNCSDNYINCEELQLKCFFTKEHSRDEFVNNESDSFQRNTQGMNVSTMKVIPYKGTLKGNVRNQKWL